MPMDRSLYPKNWDEIASAIKEAAGWRCVECGRPCRRPGESIQKLILRLKKNHPSWVKDLMSPEDYEAYGLNADIRKVGRFTLTVAHLNHQPQDCHPENLRAWCAPCHCRYDLSQMANKRWLKLERMGQLNLFTAHESSSPHL
jgi:hypothetical protein